MGSAAGKPKGFEVVDHGGCVRGVDVQSARKFLHGHWSLRDTAESPVDASEAETERVGDFSASFVVEHEIAHDRPNLTGGRRCRALVLGLSPEFRR
jgi:hypothetical protein